MRASSMLLTSAICLILGLAFVFAFEAYINNQYPSCAWCEERYGANKIAWGLTAQDIGGLILILPIASACVIGLLLCLPKPKENGGC